MHLQGSWAFKAVLVSLVVLAIIGASQAEDVQITAEVDSPKNGSIYVDSDDIEFRGTSHFVGENGGSSAEDWHLEWTSSIDGKIGIGGFFTVRLSPGEHTITLSARNAEGEGVSAQVSITVTDGM